MKLMKNGEMLLYGTVGRGFFSESGFTAVDIAEALAEHGRSKPITVRVNSGGGDAFEGMACHSQLKTHKGKVTIIVDSVAASAASVIAMAGDEIIMRRGSMMMIHDPAGMTIGNSADHEKTIEALETIGDSMADVYAERSGKEPSDARKIMKEETWFTADEAVDEGFADQVDSAKARAVAMWDYRTYRHAPDRMVALASDRQWTMKVRASKASRDAAHEEEDEMPETKKGGTQSDANSDEFKTAVTAEVERQLKARDDAVAEAAKKAAEEAAKPKTASAETPEDMEKRIRAAEQKRMADITAACNLAGQSGKAATFIAEGKSLSDVVAALQEGRTAPQKTANNGKELNNHSSSQQEGGTGEVDAKKAWGKITTRLNKRVSAQRQAASV